MRIRTNVWIEDEQGRVLYGLGRQRILEAIRDYGSIKAAAESLGMSYRGLWGRLRHSERRLGLALTDSRPGGGSGGGTKLTAAATRLLDRYEATVRQVYAVSDEAYRRNLEEIFRVRERKRRKRT
jgi:molybdate transport system regulatory protein